MVLRTNQVFQYVDGMILTPCTQGCLRTWAALSRRVASRTKSFDMRSLALSVMWAQSFSGNSYLPCWILSNRWLWGEIFHIILSNQSTVSTFSKIKFRPTVPSVSMDFLTWILGDEEKRISKSTTFNQVSCQILNFLFFYVTCEQVLFSVPVLNSDFTNLTIKISSHKLMSPWLVD